MLSASSAGKRSSKSRYIAGAAAKARRVGTSVPRVGRMSVLLKLMWKEHLRVEDIDTDN